MIEKRKSHCPICRENIGSVGQSSQFIFVTKGMRRLIKDGIPHEPEEKFPSGKVSPEVEMGVWVHEALLIKFELFQS